MKYKLLAASILATMSTSALSATYKLTEIGTFDAAKNQVVKDISENGHIIGQVSGLYNLPIDISYIDFDDSLIKRAYDDEERRYENIDKEISFTLDDIENNNAAATNPDANRFMLSFLSNRASSGDTEFQKVSANAAIKFPQDQVEAQEQVLFDVDSVDYPGLTRSVNDNYTAIIDDGVSVGWGSAPFDKVLFTPEGENEEETHFVRDFIARAAVISDAGFVTPLPPQFAEYGGISNANDIVKTATGYTVVGQVSTAIPKDRQENIDDDCDGEDELVSECIERLYTSTKSRLFELRAAKWDLDANFNVIDTQTFGLGLTPKEDDDFAFVSNALAINSNGIIVGSSDIRDKNRSNTLRTLPVYYNNNEVVEILNQDDDWYDGKALAISDNNIIVGYGRRVIDGEGRSKFFYHDIETGETVFPTDFFSTSSVIAHDVNENGYIVGEGETDVVNVGSRRKEAFLYKMGEDTITNVNDLLPCYEDDGKTRYKYVVAEAQAINDNNEIFGVATKTVEKTDTLGGVVKDKNGEIEYESVAVAVKLTPTDGQVDSCPKAETETYERQSGSLPWYTLLLLPVVGLRRLFR